MDTKQKLDFTFVHFIVFLCGVSVCVGQDTFYFNLKPHTQAVVEGTELTLQCDVSNRRHMSFQWILDGKPVLNTSRRFQEGRNLRILRITRVDDSKAFQCIATNVTTGFSLQSGEAVLDIEWLEPNASVELKRRRPEDVALGTDIQLKCQITGNPEPDIYWYQNQFRIFNKDNVKIADKGTRLKINAVTAGDNGVYSCRAENVAGEVDSTNNYLLNVEAPNTPHLIEDAFTPYKLVLKNSEARLDCPFINATKVEWFADYEKLSNSSRYTIFENGSLYFPKVRNSDEAGYRCEGLSSHRDVTAQTFTSELVIAYLDDFGLHSFEPRLISNFPMVIPLHQHFVVRAFPPDGKPAPSYRWLNKNDMVVMDTGPIHMEGSSLVFDNPQQVDSGNYTFIINNTVSEKRQNVWIIVSVPPIIRRPPSPQQVDEGESVDFSCQVTGTTYPVTTVIWQKDGQYIKLGSPRHHMNQMTGTLHMTYTVEEDVGEYSCIANTTGQELVTSQAALLTVRKSLKFNPPPPDIVYLELNGDSEVRCNAVAESRPTIHWMRGSFRTQGKVALSPHVIDSEGILYFRGVQRTDAGLYTCVAAVSQGHSQAVINRTVYIDVVEHPQFRIRPSNITSYEERSAMLHCVASGYPTPTIIWDKNHVTNNWDRDRFTFLANGTMVISRVYMEDQGFYGCTANNTAGKLRTVAYIFVASGSDFVDVSEREADEGFDMTKTVIIAVCSAGAYLALVIGLTAFCSYKLLLQRRTRKALVNNEKQNGKVCNEQHELLMKDRDHESGGTQCRSDSDNRSHAGSALSSHPSHSSHSTSHAPSQNLSQQSQRSGGGGKSGLDRLYFPRHELQTIGMLGKGPFGDVLLAKARGIRPNEIESQVVVKSLAVKDDQLFFEFHREIDMYSKLDHSNIIRLLGVCRDIEPTLCVMEHCDWGDVKQFLMASRADNTGRRRIPPLTVIQKIGMCNQVALGMEHMANMRFVHKDLAARNVLLTSRLELKISSMALSRDMYAGEYIISNQIALPLRWLSPEAALEADYSTKSDVWAFGVYVWEVFHLADMPHKNRSDDELLKGLKAGDVLLEISEALPNEIIDIVRKCTSECPKDRPLFTDVCNWMAELVSMYTLPHYSGSSSPSVVSFPSVSSYPATGIST